MSNAHDYHLFSSCPWCGRWLNRPAEAHAPGCPRCLPRADPSPPEDAPLTPGEWWTVGVVVTVLTVAVALACLFTHRGP